MLRISTFLLLALLANSLPAQDPASAESATSGNPAAADQPADNGNARSASGADYDDAGAPRPAKPDAENRKREPAPTDPPEVIPPGEEGTADGEEAAADSTAADQTQTARKVPESAEIDEANTQMITALVRQVEALRSDIEDVQTELKTLRTRMETLQAAEDGDDLESLRKQLDILEDQNARIVQQWKDWQNADARTDGEEPVQALLGKLTNDTDARQKLQEQLYTKSALWLHNWEEKPTRISVNGTWHTLQPGRNEVWVPYGPVTLRRFDDRPARTFTNWVSYGDGFLMEFDVGRPQQ